MAQRTLDTTENQASTIQLARINANFTELYASVAANTASITANGVSITAITPHLGTFTANGATPVTVTDTNVTANSSIDITLKTVGGTVGAVPAVKTITPTTGFTVAATASDTSVYNYAIVG